MNTTLIVVLVAATTSAVFYFRLRDYFWACVGATITSDILFHIFAIIHAGHIDPFILVSVLIAGIESFVVAVLVGTVFFLMRRKAHAGHAGE